MAKFQVVLSEQEVQDILINTVRTKFNINHKTMLALNWNDDSGATIETPDEPIEQSSWLDTKD